MQRTTLSRGLEIVLAAASLLVIAAHAGLLPLGQWKADEFHDFGLFRAEGWSFF